jgi:hypothetical protein
MAHPGDTTPADTFRVGVACVERVGARLTCQVTGLELRVGTARVEKTLNASTGEYVCIQLSNFRIELGDALLLAHAVHLANDFGVLEGDQLAGHGCCFGVHAVAPTFAEMHNCGRDTRRAAQGSALG